MDQKNNNVTPEEELDKLLQQFLDDPEDKLPGGIDLPVEEEIQKNWLDDLLEAPADMPEIGPDEQAVVSAGLTHPDDVELEAIIQETKASDWESSTILMNPIPDDTGTFLDQETREAFDEGKTLDQIFSDDPTLAPLPPEEPEEVMEEPEDTPLAKAAPKWKDRYGMFGIPHILSTAVWIVLVVAIGAATGQFVWACAADVLAFGREETLVTITITEEDTLDTIADKLHATGLIEYPNLFKLYGQISNADKKITAGIYELNTLYDYHALVLMMSSTSNRVTINVTIPEGFTCSQIFALLEEKGVCAAADLEAASMGELGDFWFLEGVTRDNKYSLEGFLYPDTYNFYVGDNATRVLNTILDNFAYRFDETYMEKLEALNTELAAKMAAYGLSQDYIDSHKLTVKEIVIIASMIEKESAHVKDNATMASVIYNRLCNPAAFPYLQIEAPLVYITGNAELTEEDRLLDSPYNTYVTEGLIPGAICNPGKNSLTAAVRPETSGFCYYAFDPASNRHQFFETEAEYKAFLSTLEEE